MMSDLGPNYDYPGAAARAEEGRRRGTLGMPWEGQGNLADYTMAKAAFDANNPPAPPPQPIPVMNHWPERAAASPTSFGPGPGPVFGSYAERKPVSPARKKALWIAGLFIVCGFAAISDSNVVYSNLVVSAATQFNRDFAGNTAAAGTERSITAADWLGLPFAFTMEYTTAPVADRPTAGLRSSPRSCSVARITGVLFGRLMLAARSDHMKFCR